MSKMKKHKLFVIITLLFCSGTIACDNHQKMAEKIVSQMDLKQKIGQLLLIGVPENKLGNASSRVVETYQPGGIIFFRYNIASSQQLAEYITDLQNYALSHQTLPMFMTLDQEGGRVHRLTEGVTQFPGAMACGISADQQLVYDSAKILGLELLNLGINMNLTPDLDVNNNPDNPVINTRSFGSAPQIVADLGTAYLKGVQDAGCIAVGKHFPGHGNTSTDSHKTLPIVNTNLTAWQNCEAVPFKKAIASGVEGIMTAHITYPQIENTGEPATVSSYFLTKQLKENFGFKGVIFTDDMEMNGLSGKYSFAQAAIKTLNAGADVLLISSCGESIKQLQEGLLQGIKDGDISEERINQSVTKIVLLKLRYGIIKFENEKIVISNKKILNNSEKKLLAEKEKINKSLSEKAIYFYHPKKKNFLDFRKNSKVYFFTKNNKLKKLLATDKQIVTINSLAEISAMPKNVLFVTDFSKEKELLKIKRLLAPETKLLLVCTGNPFQIKNFPFEIPVLFSFSNTNASLNAIISCLNKKFKPKEEINYYLGLN